MKKNSKVFALAGIGALALVGGTFAYYSSTQTFNNPFETSNFGTSVVEKFNPSEGDTWVPGATVDKEVYATNTGDGEVWVRVKFEEEWTAKDGELKLNGLKWDSGDDTFNPDSAKTGQQDNPSDGLVAKDTGSVVYKNITLGENWKKDGQYYYYKSALAKGQSTTKLLDDVTLCEDTDMGKMETTTYYLLNDTEFDPVPVYPAPEGATYTWTENEPDKEKMEGKYVYTAKAEDFVEEEGVKLQGYANANYTLTITTEFVQADADAATDWAWYPGMKEEGSGTGSEGEGTNP